ncbi:MAG: autotransporter-associated beta strand repeat-containing protein, partial [Dolichospermum sp.]
MKNYFTLLLIFLGLISPTISAQDLTISSTGQTGTSGTNWSISGNVLTVGASGSASINTSVITNHLTNVGDLTIVLPWQSGVWRDININSNIQYTGLTSRTLSFRSANDIRLASNVAITSSNAALNLVFITRFNASGFPDSGRLILSNSPVINTNGGHLWVGGGTLSATPWNGLTVGSSTSVTWTQGTYGLPIIGASINTNGGNVYMAGYAHYSGSYGGTSYGIYLDNSTINTGGGSITIDGSVRGSYSGGVACVLVGSTGTVNLTTTSGSINIIGNGYDQTSVFSGGARYGTLLSGGVYGVQISSQSGAISIEGNASFNSNNNEKEGILITSPAADRVRIISQSGSISLIGTNIREADGQYSNSVRFTAEANVANSIRIGYDGTNTYNGNINIQGNSIYQRNNQAGTGSISIQSTGTLTIQPTGNAFTYMRAGNSGTLTFDDDWNFGTSLSGFTYGKSTNTMNLSYASELSVAGSIAMYAGNLTLNQNLTATLNGAPILLQATGAINLAANKTIQSNAGNITFRSNSAGAALSAASSVILNSGSTLNSQGGNITLGGNFTGAQGAGLYATSGNSPAILINGGIISAAGGNIKLYGKCSTSYDDGIRLVGTINTTGSGTIELYGEAHGGNNGTDYFGGITFGSSAGSTIETENGNLILNGFLTNTQSNSTGAINFYRNNGSENQTRHINLLSKTGNITITGDTGTTSAYGIGHSSWGNVYVGSPASGWTASGNVVLNYSRLVNAGFNGIKVKTTGAVTYQPIGLSFTASQTFPANGNYVLAESASSLTIGKPSNTSSLIIGAAVSVAGPISVYGGDISVSDDISSTAGGNITLLASNGFYTSGSTSIQRDITTAGGNILIEADSDANGTGSLDLDYMVLNPGTGNTIIRGETYNWVTTSENSKPWINGTGSFTLESNDASIGQNADLVWFKIDQDANGIGGLTIGKSTNSQPVNFNSVGALTVNGPVTVNGSNVTFSTALTVANNDLNIRATGAVTQTTPIVARGIALNGTGTFTLTHASNSFDTLAGGAPGTLLGNINIIDASNGLTVGTVGSNTGILGSGTIKVETFASNLTLASNISTSNTSTDAIILTAAKNTAIGVGTGGDIIVSGSPTVTVGTGGIAKFFSGYDVTSTGLTALAGGSSNVRYNYDETSTTFNPILSANNKYAIYRTALGYGDLTIVSSGGDAEGTTWIYENGVIKTTSGAANILNTVVQAKLNAADLSIEAQKITFNANISSSSANNLKVLAKTHIENTVATSITTQGGDVLLASNVDDATDGDSTTNGRIDFRNGGLSITTNGGDITLGGENSLGTGYALGQSGGSFSEGIRIDVTTNLNSGGGNISIKGKSYNVAVGASTGGSGVGFFYLTSAGNINSGTGTILIDGYSQTSSGNAIAGVYFWNDTANVFTIQSANTSANAITINGYTTGTSGQAYGLETEGGNTLNIYATGSGGGININTGSAIAYDVVLRAQTNILSAGGPINFRGGQFGGVSNGYLWINGDLFLGSKSGVLSGTSTSNITISFDRFAFNGYTPKFATTSTVAIESNGTSFGDAVYTSNFAFNQNAQTMSSFRLGKTGNASDIYLNSAFTVAGPISAYGWNVDVTGNLTSSANGDIFIKGISGWNDIEMTSTIAKTAGTGTLTLQSNGRVYFTGPITASGSGVLNVIVWSDYDGDNGDGGSGFSGAVTTNGGHVWMGGSNSNGGSYIWNGLTVGDGPSVGGSNANAFDFFNNVTTNGGDFFAWAGTGNGGTNGIASNGSWTINAGSGDITLVSSVTSGTIGLTTTGLISLVPNGGSYASALTLGGTVTSGNYTFNTSHYNGIKINNITNVGGLTIGKYEDMLATGTPVLLGNTSNITVGSAFDFGGGVSLYGGAIALNANLSTTNTTTGNILLNCTTLSGTGNIAVATNRTATLNVSSASTYDGIISGTGSGLTKLGAGLLTLTKDHTYSGITTISAGDLQVGTGGSVSQASSGTIGATSGVAVASGSKLILTPNENVTFAAPISGAGGVEIKGMSGRYSNAWLTGTPVIFASNTSVLEVLTRITGGLMGGGAITGGSAACGAYQKSYNASTNSATLQFQVYNGNNGVYHTKCVFVKLTQSGTNVMIQANTSVNGTGGAYITANVLGADLSIGSNSMWLASSLAASGYGISEVYMSGKVNFTGNLTYTGNTLLSNTVTSVSNSTNISSYTSKGTQEITDSSSSFPSASTVINNGLVILNRSTPLTIASNMEGTEEVLQVGAAITLTGANTHSGNTTIDLNKKLVIGSGGTSGSITGNIINYGTITFNRSDASSYPGVISGNGVVTKEGAGSHTLTGLNTYTGATTITSGKLILERDVPATSSTSFSGSGHLVIQPASSSFTNAINYPISGFTISSTIGGLTIGKPSNTKNITFASTTAVAGSVLAYGGEITVTGALTSTGSVANVLLKSMGSTIITNDITTNGGDIIVWTDSDNNGSGGIRINDNVDLDSRTEASRVANSHTTGGGKIILAGGLDDGGTASGTSSLTTGLSSNDGLPDGYAVNSGSLAAQSGIALGTSTTQTGHNSNITIFSGGGDIRLHGLATNNSSAPSNGPTGLLFFQGYNINAGTTGNVTLLGNANLTSGSYAAGMDLAAWREATYTANSIIKTHNGNIALIGRSSGGTSGNLAIGVDGKDDKRNVFAATGSGAITLNGLALNTSPLDVRLTNVDLLAASGDIQITAEGTSGLAIAGYNIGDGLFIGQKTGSLVTSSSSNILIQSNTLLRNKPITNNTSGTFTFEPFGDSFANSLSYPISNLSLSNTVSGLILGKPSNTSNITFANTTTIAGPITAYGGDIAINGALTSTSSTVSLKATGSVTQTAAITATNLDLSGSGTFTLNNISNNIGTIAGGTTASKLGALSYTDSNELTIGTLTNSGIIAGGKVNVQTLSGNLNLNSNVATDNTETDAIILNAGKSSSIGTTTGGDIIVNGTPSITTGANGIAKLFSGSNGNSTGLSNLVGGSANVRSNFDETSTTFSPSLQSGNSYAIYRVRELTCEETLAITVQPSVLNSEVCLYSSPGTISFASSGSDYTIQWYSNTSNSYSGASLISGAINNLVQLQTNVLGTKYYFAKLTANSGLCTINTEIVSQTVIQSLNSISSISGPTTLTSDATMSTYSVNSVTGATSYVWNLPSGMTLTSQTGPSVTVLVSSTFESGSISVYALNGCNQTQVRTITVRKGVVPVGGLSYSITGSPIICSNATGSYTATTVSGGTYVWEVPVGLTITSGQGTNSINVSSDSSFISGTIRSRYVTSSYTLQASYQVSGVAQPSVISGPANVCGLTTATYSVTNASGVTYVWSVPSGMTITSGDNASSINVSISGNVSGNVSVGVQNSCGLSLPSSLFVKSTPIMGWISGATRVCGAVQATVDTNGNIINNNPFDTYTYSVVATEGVSYLWTVPSAATIVSGQGTNSITVSYDLANFDSGNITVQGTNSCGSGSSRSLAVSAVTGTILGPTSLCSLTTATYSVPSDLGTLFTWSLPEGMSIVTGQGTSIITVSITHPVKFNNTNQVSVSFTTGCGGTRTLNLGVNCTDYTNLTSVYCGASDIDPYQWIYTTEIATASLYRFNVYDTTGTNLLFSVERNIPYFRFFGNAFTYGTTYLVRVQVKPRQGVFGVEGAGCSVTIRNLPTTSLNVSHCGSTVTPYQWMFAPAITGASEYRFNIYDATGSSLL